MNENIKLQWDGVATEEAFLVFEEAQSKLKDLGFELELIGSRPKDRG